VGGASSHHEDAEPANLRPHPSPQQYAPDKVARLKALSGKIVECVWNEEGKKWVKKAALLTAGRCAGPECLYTLLTSVF
jgi:hypothetical protein